MEEKELKYPNPDKFVFNTNKDKANRKYFNAYSNTITKAIVVLDDKNFEFNGKPKLFVREENSVFGDEMGFVFLIENKVKEYRVNSDHQVIEFYLPKEQGIQFLKEALAFFEGRKNM